MAKQLYESFGYVEYGQLEDRFVDQISMYKNIR
jgi:hypothetical protein